MLTENELLEIAKTRFAESKILHSNHKYDGAIYLCGYALELMFKRKIVLTLNWSGFPENPKEFTDLQTFKTHSLQLLLKLSGLEMVVTQDANLFADWNIASGWKSDIRYTRVGQISQQDSDKIIKSTRVVLNWITTQ